jgi:hypothetical protein
MIQMHHAIELLVGWIEVIFALLEAHIKLRESLKGIQMGRTIVSMQK